MNWLMLLMSTLILAMLIFTLVMRYFIHLERMALIKQGVIPPSLVNPILKRGSFGLLLAGLITTLTGVGVLAGLYIGLGKRLLVNQGVCPDWGRERFGSWIFWVVGRTAELGLNPSNKVIRKRVPKAPFGRCGTGECT